jgi:hypothetical protein
MSHERIDILERIRQAWGPEAIGAREQEKYSDDEIAESEEFYWFQFTDFSVLADTLPNNLQWINIGDIRLTRAQYEAHVREAKARVKRIGKGPHPKDWWPLILARPHPDM